MKLKIRFAKQKEFSSIIDLVKAIFPKSSASIHPNDFFIIAESGKQLIGFIHFSRIKNKLILKGIGVEKEFQNKGVGSALLEYALANLKNEKEIFLKVKQGNIPALLLYSKYGFFLKKYGKVHVLCRTKPT